MAGRVTIEDLNVIISKTSSWQRSVELKIPREEVESEEKRLLRAYQKKVRVDGFRKGKVPEHIVLQRHGNDIRAEAIEAVLPKAIGQALEDNEISPLAPPLVENLEYGETGPLTVKATVEIMPEFEVKGYRGLKLEKPVREVTEQDVEEALKGLLERTAELVPVERPAEFGDYLVADILECDSGGTPIIGQRSPNRTLHVTGEGEGAEVGRQLVGVEKGFDRRVVVEMAAGTPGVAPADRAQLQRNVFLVQVKEIKEKNLPTLDDEYARALGDFEDLADLRRKVREDLEQHVEAEARRYMAGQAIDRLIQKNAIEVPESLIRRYLDSVVEDHRSAAGDQPVDEDAIRMQYRGVAQVQMKWQLMQMRIAEQEEVEVTEEEVRERVNRFADNYGIEPKEAYRVLSEQGRIDRIRADIREGKVVDLILDGAKVKEKKVSRKDREETEAEEPTVPTSSLISTDISGRDLAGLEESAVPLEPGEPTGPAARPGEDEGREDSGLIIPGR